MDCSSSPGGYILASLCSQATNLIPRLHPVIIEILAKLCWRSCSVAGGPPLNVHSESGREFRVLPNWVSGELAGTSCGQNVEDKDKRRSQRAPSGAHYSTDHVRVLMKLSLPKCRGLGRDAAGIPAMYAEP